MGAIFNRISNWAYELGASGRNKQLAAARETSRGWRRLQLVLAVIFGAALTIVAGIVLASTLSIETMSQWFPRLLALPASVGAEIGFLIGRAIEGRFDT